MDFSEAMLAPAITWLDRRAARETATAVATIGRGGWVVGLLGRALLLDALRPEVVEGAAWLLAAWDHLALRMTGVAAASLQDPADAISPGEARAVGLDERIAPPAARAGTVVITGNRIAKVLAPGAADWPAPEAAEPLACSVCAAFGFGTCFGTNIAW